MLTILNRPRSGATFRHHPGTVRRHGPHLCAPTTVPYAWRLPKTGENSGSHDQGQLGGSEGHWGKSHAQCPEHRPECVAAHAGLQRRPRTPR